MRLAQIPQGVRGGRKKEREIQRGRKRERERERAKIKAVQVTSAPRNCICNLRDLTKCPHYYLSIPINAHCQEYLQLINPLASGFLITYRLLIAPYY